MCADIERVVEPCSDKMLSNNVRRIKCECMPSHRCMGPVHGGGGGGAHICPFALKISLSRGGGGVYIL